MHTERKLSTYAMAMENIRRKPLRSLVLIVFILLFTLVLLLGSLISMSLSNGIESLSNRLGADVMVVPPGHEAKVDAVLLRGKPCEFYLPKDVLEKLSKIEGIKQMSTQTYLTTLKAACCSYPLQIIGIDYQSDFIIKPWLEETVNRDLRDGEIIIGYHVEGEIGENLKFFGMNLKIAGKLEQTGMGFDATVFVTQNTAAKLAIEAERIKKLPLSDDGSLVSTVMIKLEPGYDSVSVAKEITKKYASDGIYGMFSKKFVNTVSSNLSVVSSYMLIIIMALWLLSAIVISLVFTMIFNERKKEMGILRVLGASKKKLSNFMISEAFIISAFASFLGTGLALLVLVVIKPTISEAIKIPFLLPPILTVILLSILCFIVGVFVGPLSSLLSVRKVNKYDIYQSMREE